MSQPPAKAPHPARKLLSGPAYWVRVGVAALVAGVVLIAGRLSSSTSSPSVTAPSPPARSVALGNERPSRVTLAGDEQVQLKVSGAGPVETLYEGTVDQSDPAVEVISVPGKLPVVVRARHPGRAVISVLTDPPCPTPGAPGAVAMCSHLRRSLGSAEFVVTG